LIIDQDKDIQTIKDELASMLIFDNIDLLGIFESINASSTIKEIKNIIDNYNNQTKNF
jgi:hypothetical protein